ncbi:hypothetical protein GALMADRAFT_207969 [Galerina marginata CBS 339.88]|uniref:Protein kinase domain-containing protein n=1 Tax=Galerina marginata (strain CBS 339.88) TaxID=685588 RepID=A0A067TQ65_GALM3|nr:hypothetical protein GALMADRAFT_207969 [Galerina marginata CBS 339.88]
MPRILLSSFPSPRFRRADFLSDRYSITRVSRSGIGFQLIEAFDVESCRLKMVKVLSRKLLEDGRIISSLQWLLSRKTADGRHSVLCNHFSTSSHWFFVFDFPRFTLRDVLKRQDLWPLERRQIRDISFQIVQAVQSLHKTGILHSDITPDSIEILSMDTVVLNMCDDEGAFYDKSVLRSTKIRLVFFGGVGTGGDPEIGTDQYRAPEMVFGCVIWELFIGSTLFIPCKKGPLYIQEKVHQFVARLGEFPDDMVRRIRRIREDIFCHSEPTLVGEGDLSSDVRDFVHNAVIISDIITDEDVLEVVENMTKLSPKKRMALSDILECPFFGISG